MAMMDNKSFLISHLRNSFITSDDTGMCEMIIDIEEEDERLKKKRMDSSLSDSGVNSSDNELSHSYDILPDMDYVAHRRRSNTAQRLERLKKEKRNQSKVKAYFLDTGTEYNIEEKGFLFDKKDMQLSYMTSPFECLASFQIQMWNSVTTFFQDEKIHEVMDRIKELLDVAVTEDDIDVTSERVATKEDWSGGCKEDEEEEEEEDKNASDLGKDYLAAGLGILVATVAAGLTYVFAKNS